MTAVFDPLAGLSNDTSKEELMERLRKAAAALRRSDRQQKAKLQEIEERLKAKGRVQNVELLQVIASASKQEWTDAVEFLEEFEHEGLLPVALKRLADGGRTLLGAV